jgi:hypothetical protein
VTGGRLPAPPATAAGVLLEARAGSGADRPAYATLVSLLTVAGRVPYDDGLAALMPWERQVLHEVMGRDHVRLLAADDPGCDVWVAYSPQGRLSLLAQDERRTVAGPELIGGLGLGPTPLERAAEAHDTWWAAEQPERDRLDQVLASWEADGSLRTRVGQVADWVERVETVLIYIGRQVFSRSDAGSSTLRREGILTSLADRPLAAWSSEERLFVAAAHVLFQSGRSVRFEEFNGQQLTALGLRGWLTDRWRRYAAATGKAIPADLNARPAESLAGQVAELAATVDESAWLRFRRISGVTFAKREVIACVPLQSRHHQVLPPTLAELAADESAVRAGDAANAEQAIGDAVRRLGTIPHGAGHDRLESLLAAIVAAAVRDLRADYGMSSGVRSLDRLRDTARGRLSQVLELSKPDFFCCALPHPDLILTRTRPEITRLLWLVAQRMQYNRWHFVPGNFDRSEVPADRHYFFPPTMPDIAEHSDLWHGGHVSASVRYSIRAPGAPLWRPALAVGGNSFRGGYDIRVVRTGGTPFTTDELWAAVRYSGLIDAFWRALAALPSRPVIAGFGKEWYEAGAWTAFADATTLQGGEKAVVT